MSKIKLYPFQTEGCDDIMKLWKMGHSHVCLSWYTGAGKTNVIAEICKRLIKEDPTVHIGISAYLTIEIKHQVYERLTEYGLGNHVHMINRGGIKFKPDKQITVFNPWGLHYNKPDGVKFDYLILDEAHSGLNEYCTMLPGIIKKLTTKKTKHLLVSATPWDTLMQKEFKGAVNLKRPLDQGFDDGLITDFVFHAEEANIEFSSKDFTRVGDINIATVIKEMQVLKSACIGKLDNIVKKHNKSLGDKVLVICPPGNFSEIARDLAKRFGGLAFVMEKGNAGGKTRIAELEETKNNLELFKKDPKIRFLFVVNKCQVGFDFQAMTSVIDLTMSRNIRALAQRMGRIARKNGRDKKHYFYVYDKSLMKDRLEWLVLTVTDFCLGAYDGWSTKTAKYRPVESTPYTMVHPITTTIKSIIKALREPGAIETRRVHKFVQGSAPKKWTLEKATAKAMSYKDRTEMWSKQPSLYKWFRLNAKPEMDRIFPLKNKLGKWNEDTVTAVCKEHAGKMGRREFLGKYSGAEYWLTTRGRKVEFLDKYFPLKFLNWNEERAREAIRHVKTWHHVRNIGGLRSWMIRNKGEHYYRKIWVEVRNETPRR